MYLYIYMVHNNSGVYQINILVDEEHGVAIGKSGTFTFQKGSYVYTGFYKFLILAFHSLILSRKLE